MLVSVQVPTLGTVVLVSTHYLDVVIVKLTLPPQTLLEVGVQVISYLTGNDTITTCILSKIRVGNACIITSVIINIVYARECNVLRQININGTSSIKCVTLVSASVNQQIADRVGLAQVRTAQTKCTVAVTIVISLDAGILIVNHVTELITYEHRIDRSNIMQGKEVSHVRFSLVAHIAAVGMRIRNVCTGLQPLLQHIVCLQTCRQSLVVAVVSDTLVAQIVRTDIVCTLVRSTAGTYCVLLAQAVVINLVVPVVRNQIVLVAILACNHVTQGSIRINLAVCTDESLTLGNVIHLISETITISAVNHVGISPLPCTIAGHTALVLGIAIKSLVIGLVVTARIADDIIVAGTLHVGTPLCLEVNLGILVTLTCLGSNDDNSVTATCTVQGCRSSILQHSHALHIHGVDVIPTAIVWTAVQHNQRIIAGNIHRIETTDTDGRSGARLTRCIKNLHTGSLTLQGVKCICNLHLADFLAVQNSG